MSNWKLAEKTKFPKFGTKNALFGFIWGRILKNYCHISNQHPQICLILEPKMSYLGIFGLEFENNIVIFEYSTFEFV